MAVSPAAYSALSRSSSSRAGFLIAHGARLDDHHALQRRQEPESYTSGLTRREVEVLRLVADGLTDGQTAEQLHVSPRTVGNHLRSVYNKLGVPSRAAAVRRAIEQGML